MKKKEIKINGNLQESLLKGAKILQYHNGIFLNTFLVEYSNDQQKEDGFKFALYQDLPSIDSDKMCLMTQYRLTKRESLNAASLKHYNSEVHHEMRYNKKNT